MCIINNCWRSVQLPLGSIWLFSFLMWSIFRRVLTILRQTRTRCTGRSSTVGVDFLLNLTHLRSDMDSLSKQDHQRTYCFAWDGIGLPLCIMGLFLKLQNVKTNICQNCGINGLKTWMARQRKGLAPFTYTVKPWKICGYWLLDIWERPHSFREPVQNYVADFFR